MKKVGFISLVHMVILYLVFVSVGFAAAAGKGGGKPGSGGTPNAEIIYKKDAAFMVALSDGSGQSTIMSASGFGRPSWTPDGSGFLFGGDPGNLPGIYYQEFDNITGLAIGQPKLLRAMATASAAQSANPQMSPVTSVDGNYKIVFHESQDGFTNDLYLMNCDSLVNCDGSDVTQLTPLDSHSDEAAKWSPSGNQLVVLAYDNVPGQAATNFSIQIIDLALSPTTGQVIEDKRTNLSLTGDLATIRPTSPDWSPTGDSIVVAGLSESTGWKLDLYLILLSTPDVAYNLTNTPDIEETLPVFSPDGTQILHRVVAASDPCVSKGRKSLDGLAIINVGSPFGSCPRNYIIDGGRLPDWRRYP